MPLWWQDWRGLTVQKGTRGLWRGVRDVSAAYTIHGDLTTGLISFSRKGAQEILSYTSWKVNYTTTPWRNSPHALCYADPVSPVPPLGETWQPWLLPTFSPLKGLCGTQLQGIPSFLPEAYCFAFTSHWKKLSIVTSCDKEKQQINPKGSGRKANVSL